MIIEQLKILQRHKLNRQQQLLLPLYKKMAQCKQEIINAKEALKKYVDWRIEEENRLYQEAYEKCLSQRGIDDLRYEISKLRAHDATLNQRILDAENQLDWVIKEKDDCQKQIAALQKLLEKYEILIEEEMSKAKKLREQEEEKVLDEFSASQAFRVAE